VEIVLEKVSYSEFLQYAQWHMTMFNFMTI